MITLTKLNGVKFVLNCDLIETVFETPDTTIHLTNGNIYIVQERMREVVEKTIQLKREIFTKGMRGDFYGEKG